MFFWARQTTIKEWYQVTFSNLTFEFSFLLHFSNQTTPVEKCVAAIKLLKNGGWSNMRKAGKCMNATIRIS